MRKALFLYLLLITGILYSHNEVKANLDPVVRETGEKILVEGAKYLLSKQADDGSWATHPAITALCIMAVTNAPIDDKKALEKATNMGLDFVVSYVQPDGSIWSTQAKEYPNYTTAIALLALSSVNRPQDLDIIKNARNYLKESQYGNKRSIDYGGIGYGKTGRADLSNLNFAAEALYFTDYLDKEPYNNAPEVTKKNEELWQKVQIFLTNCQNLPETNKQAWVSNRDDDYGGFVYRPTESKAGSITDESGKVSLLSSGSMTYAGLKSMIYARMAKDDYRVKAAIEYASRHYTLDENPGMGLQGLYYYLHVMSKALHAYGEDVIVDAQGTSHKWREGLIQKLSTMQKTDGSWVNENGRFMESLPEMATSHSLNALRMALGPKKN